MSEARLISKREVARQLGVSPSTIYRFRLAGNFPDPVLLGTRKLRWQSEEIDQWKRANARLMPNAESVGIRRNDKDSSNGS
jgi:predicted DNA-binding transcriptional regulator AlpA